MHLGRSLEAHDDFIGHFPHTSPFSSSTQYSPVSPGLSLVLQPEAGDSATSFCPTRFCHCICIWGQAAGGQEVVKSAKTITPSSRDNSSFTLKKGRCCHGCHCLYPRLARELGHEKAEKMKIHGIFPPPSLNVRDPFHAPQTRVGGLLLELFLGPHWCYFLTWGCLEPRPRVMNGKKLGKATTNLGVLQRLVTSLISLLLFTFFFFLLFTFKKIGFIF